MMLDAQGLAGLKTLLEQQERALRAAIAAEKAAAGAQRSEMAGSAHDRGDEAVADVIADTDSSLASRHFEEWRAVGRALDRIASGEYGTCIDCSEPIAAARLHAAPSAERCVVCQERHDRAYAHGARPAL